MKSKKGKAPPAAAPRARVPGKRAPAGLGAKVTLGTCQPRAPRLGPRRPLC